MNGSRVERDERTIAVENEGYRWSYLALSFGLLGIIAFRSFAHGEESWDLVGLVLLGGAVNAGYQARRRVVSRRWGRLAVATLVAAALVGLLMVLLRR